MVSVTYGTASSPATDQRHGIQSSTRMHEDEAAVTVHMRLGIKIAQG